MPKRVDHERRRGEIADAAWRLIGEGGPESLTLREVSVALGVAPGAPAHYFDGRAAIVEHAFRRALDRVDARVARRTAALSGTAALRVFCEEVTAHAGVPFARVAASGPEPAAVLAEATARWRVRLATRLDEGRRAGEVVVGVRDEVLVEQLLALLHGLQALAPPGAGTVDAARGPGGADAAPAPAEVISAFLGGLGGAARSGTARPDGAGTGAVPRSPDRTAAAPGGAGAGGAGEVVGPDGGTVGAAPGGRADGFLALTDVALTRTGERLPGTDRAAMALVLNLHRIAGSLVYDLESTVHRPAGWSWSAFRLLFTLWVAGGQEAGRAAELCGMSRAAVSSLANTLAAAELVRRSPAAGDRRAVQLSLTDAGTARLVTAFGRHNRRESQWAALLDTDDLAALNALLVRLARAAHRADWINRRT
ncbi:MarR family transcriptional regulator [Pseudonocardia sp. ICBG1293]|uniref:MarR family transcriptional regulator n=1 Tax=Pseudonocardia sp. ICBG1293 TaxID=2844382 RepID=UPI0027E0EA9E|nr:MarR family transcriptional regulator [Pseudonocardia sp. ICBG1293]